MYRVIESRHLTSPSTAPAEDKPGPLRGSAWRETTLLTQNGQVTLAVAIGPDGMVWSFRSAEKAEDNASSPVFKCTDLSADTIALGCDGQGRVVVFAAYGDELGYCVCTDTNALHWTAPTATALELPSDANRIERVMARRQNGSLRVGVLYSSTKPEEAQALRSAFADFDRDGASFQHTPVYFSQAGDIRAKEALFSMAASIQGATMH